MDNDNEEVIAIQQLRPPSVWMEWISYAGMVGLFAGAYIGNALSLGVLTAWALYWNFNLFSSMRAFVQLYNTKVFKDLVEALAEIASNNHKDGTIPERGGLTKEQESEGDR